MASPSQVPTRFPGGVTTDPPYGPLSLYGFRNPFFYHEWEDDFDGVSAKYTQTKTGNGTLAATAGDGGLATFTTNTSTPAGTDVCSIQLPAASFTFTPGKKSFFLTRLQTSDAINADIVAGLIQTTATPLAVTDGLFFQKTSGAATFELVSMVGSVATILAIPASVYTFTNNTFIDLAWVVDRKQNILAYIGSQLVGWIPQSGTGPVNFAGVSLLPVDGPIAAIRQSVQPVTLTSANLNFTLALASGTATSKSMTVDFGMVAKER